MGVAFASPGQALPHIPQCAAFVIVLMHWLLQFSVPAGHEVVHILAEHTSPTAQG
jgi:hypothetical protein